MRCDEAGYFSSKRAGRMGRGNNSPPQFGQTQLSFSLAQSEQKVHSNVQIIAHASIGERSQLQHSQLGRISNMIYPTLPSSFSPNNFVASTANSIGNSRNTSLQKPLIIIDTASSVDTPR